MPFDQLITDLEQRLSENPDDLEGWILLGRSYKTLQRYDDARSALEQASRVAPGNPLVTVELAEAMIFMSDSADIGGEIRGMLEEAVAVDPELQKGLWLLGIAAAQAGDDAAAIGYWQRLMPQLEPGSGVAQSVQQQLDLARSRLDPESATAWPGIETTVSAEEVGAIPADAVLFVIARDPASPRPPLGARRVPNPQFPVTVTMTDADAMMGQRPLSGVAEIELLARLSLTGDPIASPGDPQSPVQRVSIDHSENVRLKLASTPE